jgi:hypothetical protein
MSKQALELLQAARGDRLVELVKELAQALEISGDRGVTITVWNNETRIDYDVTMFHQNHETSSISRRIEK